MTCVIVDYGSGNLHSAEKAFQRMAAPCQKVVVSADPEEVARADRIVLPGVGAFADCRAGLMAVTGLYQAISDRVAAGHPFLGICVGMQLMARRGLENGTHPGFGWIPGEVVKLLPEDETLKIPHMGWNELRFDGHPLFAGIEAGTHAYFVHSYHLAPEETADCIAHADYGQPVTAAVARGNLAGTQFHPEKSQSVGLKLIGNFLAWTP